MGILKIPRITTTNRTGLTLGLGELVYDTDLDEIYKGDGATSGGIAIASGTGDVVGPASAVNNHVVFFDNTTGKLIKDSGLTLSGTNTGDQTITLTGDVTGSGTGSFAASISAGSVTLAKMANVATGTVFYRTTAGTGSPEVQTLATLKTDLGLSGTNSGDQTITLTGDVTGSGTGSFATTIGANKVTLGMMATLSAYSIIGNNTGSSATPLALTGTQVTSLLDTASATVNGVLSSTDWSTFNGKQAALSGTGIVKSTSGTISYLTDNSANWDTAYSDRLKWDGGATGLVASTGRTSLGLVIGTDVQAYDADLEAIATISGTSGLLKKTAVNTWSLDTNTYLTTNTLLTGLSGGQTVIGGTAASNNLTLSSTSNATKGKVILGTLSAYDEANDRLGIGTTSPSYGLHIVKSSGTSLFIDSTASGSTAFQANGTTTVTSGTTPHALIQLTSSPVTNSSAGSRSLYMRHNLNASTINFTGSAQNGPTSAWFENRIINAGTITSILGSFTSGLLMGGDVVTCGTVTDAVGIRAIGLNSFNNSVANTVTNSRAFYAHNAVKNTSTLTNQVGLNVEALSAANNNTAILLGTTTIPSGNFAIYSAGTETSYFAGSIQIADKDLILGTGAGTKIGTVTSQKLAFWNKTPIVQPTTSLTVSLTFTANTGTAVNDASTFGGYTLKQIAQALINIGILA